jgi:hypothetical protein
MVPDVVAAHVEEYHTDHQPARAHRWLATRALRIEAAPGELASIAPDAVSPDPFEEGEIETGKGSIAISSTSHGGRVQRLVRAEGRGFDVTYEVGDLPGCRFGPEFPVSAWRGVGSLRVDGGTWQMVDMPMMVSGHRFRFRHTGRLKEILIELRQPGELFALPLTTAIEDESGSEELQQGVLFWPHWVSPAGGTYRLTVEVLDLTDEVPEGQAPPE